jgi:hypothetical protein
MIYIYIYDYMIYIYMYDIYIYIYIVHHYHVPPILEQSFRPSILPQPTIDSSQVRTHGIIHFGILQHLEEWQDHHDLKKNKQGTQGRHMKC